MTTGIRRGLPRVTDGDSWPPGKLEVDAGVPRVVTATIASFESLAHGSKLAPVSTPASDPVLVRQGLPRVADGNPWPPITLAVDSAVPRLSQVQKVDAALGRNHLDSMISSSLVSSNALAAGGRIRRGLPRTLDSESWPPANLIVAAPVPRVPRSVRQECEKPTAVRGALTVVQGSESVASITPAATAHTASIFTSGRSRLTRGGGIALAMLTVLSVGVVAVFMARMFVGTEAGFDFLRTYPGETHLPEWAPVGFPGWLGWQHFLNAFLLVLIIRTGWLVRITERPSATWMARRPFGPQRKISIELWAHLSLDILWLINGIIFVVLLFATGHWVRVVPTSWEVLPNAASAAIQYLSLDWPTENGWVNYNSLQVIAYFSTIFVAAPLAAATGIRLSSMWPTKWTALSRAYSVELARAIHFPVMLYFVAFILGHVTLVMATGALRNLNHMYAGQDAVHWWGAGIFGLSLMVMVVGWMLVRPFVLKQIGALFGTIGR